MYNRDHYDRLQKSINYAIDVDDMLCEILWLIGDEYDLDKIQKARKLIDEVLRECANNLDTLMAEKKIDFGDGNRTDHDDFIDICQRKEKK